VSTYDFDETPAATESSGLRPRGGSLSSQQIADRCGISRKKLGVDRSKAKMNLKVKSTVDFVRLVLLN
jgi:DNA-binding CsgD family transcriptional regulator